MDRVVEYVDKEEIEKKAPERRIRKLFLTGSVKSIQRKLDKMKASGCKIEGVYKQTGCEKCWGKGYNLHKDVDFE